MQVDSRLKWLRTAQGWSQQELARRAGISRTEVSGIETGRLTPSVGVAIMVARLLDCRVEDVFSIPRTTELPPRWATPPRPGGRFWQAEVHGRTMLFAVEPTAAGQMAHDGVLVEGIPRAREGQDLKSTLVVAGCDPAVGLLAAELLAHHGIRLLPLTRSSRAALELLREGTVHLAGVHLSDGNGRSVNRRAVREMLGPGYRLLRLVRWQEGLAYADHLDLGETTEIKSPRLRWVARDEGSGARACLERILEKKSLTLNTPHLIALDHRGTAEAIRGGWADAGVCIQLAAEEAGLSFLAVEEETYDLVYRPDLEGDPRLDALLATVKSHDFCKVLNELPGYDARMTGEVRIA